MEPTTPIKRPNAPSGFKHLDTPTKSRIRGVKEFVAFLEENDLTYREGSTLRNLAKCFGPNTISKSSISRALSSTTDRRRPAEEKRGRPQKSEEEKQKEKDALLEQDRMNEQEEQQEAPNYDLLRADLQIPPHISDAKIKRALGRHFGAARDGKVNSDPDLNSPYHVLLSLNTSSQGRFTPRASTTPARPKKSHKKMKETHGNSNINRNSNDLLPNPTPMDLLYESQQPQAIFSGLQQLQEASQGVVGNYHWGEVDNSQPPCG
jgi:transposase